MERPSARRGRRPGGKRAIGGGPGLVLALFAWSCAGQRPPAAGSVPSSPGAPAWALEPDAQDSSGRTFNCEGAGATEEQALSAAQAICNAKICTVCGVEVEAVVETTETLTSVEMTRKIVERCRRVRKAEDTIRYKQSSCGPDGCTSWLQVFYSKEAESLECKAYADENFADPDQCENLIEQFRSTDGLTASSFARRASLLSQAISACANIDVRPTPRLQALDEVLWQGVSARQVPWTRAEDDEAAPIDSRVRRFLADGATTGARNYARGSYGGLPRQGLLETKIFVDRVKTIRDHMHGYQRLMRVWEALTAYTAAATLAAMAKSPAPPATVLLQAMGELKTIGRHSPAEVHFRVVRQLIDSGRDAPAVFKWLKRAYPAARLQNKQLRAMQYLILTDRRITAGEWRYLQANSGCGLCNADLFKLADHGRRLSDRLLEAINLALRLYPGKTRRAMALIAALNARQLLDLEERLPVLVRREMQWKTFARLLDPLPPRGADSAADSQRLRLVKRMQRQLKKEISAGAERTCDDLNKKLEILETQGADTKWVEGRLCACLTASDKERRVGNYAKLYLRALSWRAACVGGK